ESYTDRVATATSALCVRNPLRYRHTSRRSLNRPRRLRLWDLVWFVLGLGLQRKQPGEVLCDLAPVLARFSKKDHDLVVVLSCGAASEAEPGDRVGCVYRGVDREARRRDRSSGLELARRGREILLGLFDVREHLLLRNRARAHLARHCVCPSAQRGLARR